MTARYPMQFTTWAPLQPFLLLSFLLTLIAPSLSLQGPDFDSSPAANFIYSSFYHDGPNSVTNTGPQSMGNFLSAFLRHSSARTPRTPIMRRSNIFTRRGPSPRTRSPRKLTDPSLFVGTSYIHAGDDGDDASNPNLPNRGLKFETLSPAIPTDTDYDDDCEGCGGVIKHPCCFMGAPTL